MQWFKHDHNTRNDPKLALVAQKTGFKRSQVYAVWCALMECAADATDRGSIETVDWEAFAFALDEKEEDVLKIVVCFEGLKRPMIARKSLCNFLERNETSTERVKRHRQKKRKKPHRREESRVEENRIEEKKEPPKPPEGGKFSGSFLVFWQAFPHKVGKIDASQKFAKAEKHVDWPGLEKVIERVRFYERTKPADRAFCNPATWLGQGRWLDSDPGEEGEANIEEVCKTWKERLEGHYHRREPWPPFWGPKPGEAGCTLPAQVLAWWDQESLAVPDFLKRERL
jgi:hypothetical protein